MTDGSSKSRNKPAAGADTKPVIRPAAARDLDAILALLPQLADFDVPPRRDPRDLWAGDAALARAVLAGEVADSYCHVAVDADDQPLGVTLVTLREELLSHTPSAHLEAIVVSPAARGRGLGRVLLKHAETLARDHRAQSLSLHVFAANSRARALYDQSGFDSELIRAIKWLD